MRNLRKNDSLKVFLNTASSTFRNYLSKKANIKLIRYKEDLHKLIFAQVFY